MPDYETVRSGSKKKIAWIKIKIMKILFNIVKNQKFELITSLTLKI